MTDKILVSLTTLPGQNEQSGASPITVTANGNTRSYGDFSVCRDGLLLLEILDVQGTSPTITIKFMGYDESSDKWREVHKWENLDSVGLKDPVPIELHYYIYRVEWVVGGADPSFTFKLTAIGRT